MRVVLDVNWLVSATINAGSRDKFGALLLDERLTFYACAELIREYEAVMHRPSFAKKVSTQQVMDFRDIFLERTELVSIGAIPSVVRDAKDDYLIALSEVSEADYLVTGDSELLVLENPVGHVF